MSDRESGCPPLSPRWLTRGVVSVGLASFFSDAGHEITTSILPTFVTTTLRSSAGALGAIEGISNALIGVAKLVAGPVADDPHRRRELARGGYLVTAAATGAIGLAATVWQAGLLRAGAWMARGARSPARDALLASLVAPGAFGRAFGLERAGDNLGAVAGPHSRSRCSSSATARRLVLSCDEDRDLAAVLVACADLGYERRQLIGQRLDATTQPVEVRPAPADLGLALVSLPGGPAPPRLRLPRRPAPRPRSARADSWSPPRARGRRARSAASPRDGRPCASAGLRRRAMPSGGRALQAWTCVRR